MSVAVESSELTEIQYETYSYIYEFTKEHGFQPGLRDVAAHFGLASPTGVYHRLGAVVKKGYIAFSGSQSRAIRFLRRPDGNPFRGFADKA